MANLTAQRVIEQFDGVFGGPNGDYPAVLESLAGITAQQAIWRPAWGCNSIWQIVEHLSSSIEWQLAVLHQGSAELTPWIEPAGSQEAWQAALVRLRDAHARLSAAIEQMPEERLLSVPAGEKQTLAALLLSMAAHDAHHGGQIDYVRGLQSALSVRGA